MKTLDQWLSEYAESHQNQVNIRTHKICVPLIFFSVVGFILMIPIQVGPVPLSFLLIAAVLVWYWRLSRKAFLVMVGEFMICFFIFQAMAQMMPPGPLLLIIFVAAWIAQFVGHSIEGKRPSLFKDIQFLLIGPLWVAKGFLQKR